MESQDRRDHSGVRWNPGGWFGGQLGATLWLLVLGTLLTAQSRPVGLIVLLLGLLPNALGLALWQRRYRLAPYPAVQLLIAVCGLSAFVALLAILRPDADPAAVQLSLPRDFWFLLVYPGLMITLHFRERASRRISD